MSHAVLDAISEIDREWFEQHAGARVYVRPFIPGEVPPDVPVDANYTLVIQMFPGGRMRLPVRLYREYDTPLTEIVHIATGERWTVTESGAVLPAKGTRRPIWEALTSGESQQLLEAGFTVEEKGEWMHHGDD
jgi:hypothetical protein